MKYAIFILGLLIYASCRKCDNDPVKLPVCIEQLLENDSSVSIRRVRLNDIDGELHYWMNTDYILLDGEEFILNNQCDTVCRMSGLGPTAVCLSLYTKPWKTIWER